jgi:hypothetical protein
MKKTTRLLIIFIMIFVTMACQLAGGDIAVSLATFTPTMDPAVQETQTLAAATLQFTPDVTPSRTRTPTDEPGVLFHDDFSDSESGWYEPFGFSEYGDVTYRAGGLELIDQPDTVLSIAYRDEIFHGDTEIEVEVVPLADDSTDNYAFGVGCRIAYDSEMRASGYLFFVHSYGDGMIARINRGVITNLTEWTNSDRINGGEYPNTMTAECSGSTISLYINGRLVVSTEDTSFTYGEVLLFLESYDDTEQAALRFDNLYVRQAGSDVQGSQNGSIQGPSADQGSDDALILFTDDFSDSRSGWSLNENEYGQVSYTDGALTISSYVPRSLFESTLDQVFDSGVSINVTAVPLSGPANNEYQFGVGCRIALDDDGFISGYYFILLASGHAVIARVDHDTYTVLAQSEQVFAAAEIGTPVNMTAICAGSMLMVLVDDQVAAMADDSAYGEGRINLIVQSNQGSASVQFDDLSVTEALTPGN